MKDGLFLSAVIFAEAAELAEVTGALIESTAVATLPASDGRYGDAIFKLKAVASAYSAS